MVQLRLISVVTLAITVLGFGSLASGVKDDFVKLEGKTGSSSRWLNNNMNDIPGLMNKGRSEATSKVPKFSVRLITTNTRLGQVDVKSLENRTLGIIVGKNPPDNIYHSAVIVHDNVFEFIFDKGIDATVEESYINDNQPVWYDYVFTTEKTKKDIKAWLLGQLKVFNQGTYHIVDHNCFHFAKAMTEFLGGTEPAKFVQQREWLTENKDVGDIVQTLLEFAYALNAPEENSEPTTHRSGR